MSASIEATGGIISAADWAIPSLNMQAHYDCAEKIMADKHPPIVWNMPAGDRCPNPNITCDVFTDQTGNEFRLDVTPLDGSIFDAQAFCAKITPRDQTECTWQFESWEKYTKGRGKKAYDIWKTHSGTVVGIFSVPVDEYPQLDDVLRAFNDAATSSSNPQPTDTPSPTPSPTPESTALPADSFIPVSSNRPVYAYRAPENPDITITPTPKSKLTPEEMEELAQQIVNMGCFGTVLVVVLIAGHKVIGKAGRGAFNAIMAAYHKYQEETAEKIRVQKRWTEVQNKIAHLPPSDKHRYLNFNTEIARLKKRPDEQSREALKKYQAQYKQFQIEKLGMLIVEEKPQTPPPPPIRTSKGRL
jgi:hypothetical protein